MSATVIDNAIGRDVGIPAFSTEVPSSPVNAYCSSPSTTQGVTGTNLEMVCGPSGIGMALKCITNGLSILIKQYAEFINNKEDFRRIAFRTEWLCNYLIGPAEEDGMKELHRRIHLKSQLDAILEKLEPMLVLHRTGSLTDASPVRMISSLVEDIRDAIIDYQTSLQYAIYDRNYKRLDTDDLNVLNRLRHANDADYSSGNGRQCLRGTRIQVLEYIEDWAEDRNNKRVYWLNGVAGSGKTTIARTFASRVFAGGRLGACFFCSRDFTDRSNLHFIFPTLAFQLAHRFRDFRAHLVMTIKSNPNIAHESLTLQLENLIIEPLRRTGLQTIIIIDALDECKDDQPASAILSLLARYVDQVPLVKFFITGRPEPRIRSGFRLPLLRPHTDVYVLHDVDSATVNHDIELFLRTGLSELILEREDLSVVDLHRFVDALVRKSDGLFIYADTILKFIAAADVDLKDRLELIVCTPDNSSKEGSSGLDSLYNQIIDGSYIKIASEAFFDRLRLVLGTVALVFNPLSRATIGALLDMRTADILGSLRSLHSLLLVPDSASQPIRAFHKSFPDYLTDSSRCRDNRFYVNANVYHAKIAIRCLELMQKKLKKNICDLPPYVMNEDVEDIFSRRMECIGDAMEYACQFWGKHIRLASGTDDELIRHILTLLRYFLENLPLFWFEVLSIMGDLRSAIHSLHDVQGWLIDLRTTRRIGRTELILLDRINDAERFLLYFFDPIQASASHIHHSALPWSPTSSLIREAFHNQVAMEVKVLAGVDPSWNACLRTVRVGESVHSVAISHNGNLIAASTKGTVKIFEAATGVCSCTLNGHWPIAFSPDDALLACGSENSSFTVWDLQTGGLARTFNGHTGLVTSVGFSPTGIFVASGSDDGTARIWDVVSRSSNYIVNHDSRISVVGWSGDGMHIVTISHCVKVWDVVTMTCLNTFHIMEGDNVAYSRTSSRIVCVSASGGKIYDAPTGEVLSSILDEEEHQFDRAESICFSPSGDQILYASGKSAYVRDWLRGTVVSTFVDHTSRVRSVASSPRGTVVSGSDNGFLKVWQPGKQNVNFGDENETMDGICFVQNGKLVATTGRDIHGGRFLSMWDAITGSRTPRRYNNYSSFAFSPDSSFVCGAGESNLEIRNVDTGRLIRSIKTNRTVPGGHDYTCSVCFSPNSCQIAVLDAAVISLFDVSTGHCVATLCHDNTMYRSPIFFSADGAIVMTRSSQGDGVKRLQAISSRPRILPHLLRPMGFVALPDDENPLSHYVPPPLYRLSEDKDWVLDQGGKKVCWIPQDRRGGISNFYGDKFAITYGAKSIIIIDFSNLPS